MQNKKKAKFPILDLMKIFLNHCIKKKIKNSIITLLDIKMENKTNEV